MNPAVKIYRVAHWLHCKGLRKAAFLLSWMNRLLFSTWLPGSARIGTNFSCGYWGLGVVVHSDAVIGDNCLISQNVTVGRNGDKPGVPHIGNNVYVGAGAVVVGGINVGNFSKIGANSVVLSNVPDGAVVVGAPARVVRIDSLS